MIRSDFQVPASRMEALRTNYNNQHLVHKVENNFFGLNFFEKLGFLFFVRSSLAKN
jgi:hypothetical protein